MGGNREEKTPERNINCCSALQGRIGRREREVCVPDRIKRRSTVWCVRLKVAAAAGLKKRFDFNKSVLGCRGAWASWKCKNNHTDGFAV
jgi:hypothetical protein